MSSEAGNCSDLGLGVLTQHYCELHLVDFDSEALSQASPVSYSLLSMRTWLIYPRGAVVLLIVDAVILFLPLPLSGIIFAVAVAWMGCFLFREKDEGAVRSR